MRISDWSSDVALPIYRIVRFLEVRGAGDNAEDLFQDLWMRLTDRRMGPIADPLPYVMRAANNLMLDRYRSARQRELRDKRSEEHTSELQSLMRISYAVFCLKKKKKNKIATNNKH